MIQGGDFEKGNGSGGYSIYGAKFKDEAFLVKHTKRGILSMANCGKDTNASQFFICLSECNHLDGKHVAFGQIIKNVELLDKLEAIETVQKVETGADDKPAEDIVIVDCGQLD